jgi:lipopolysaccharide/colanic/teichoic acid biosynthesis glycosyltransferase
MITFGRRSSALLFVGDIAALALALYVTLAVRYLALPSAAALAPYWAPFSFLFALWLVVFYGAGLYGKQFLLFPSRLPDALVKTQVANILFAAVFFFLVPAFGITPKTILALYLVVSLGFVLLWRLALYPKLSAHPRRERVVLVAEGAEADELFTEVNGNPRYGIEFCARPSGAALADRDAFLASLHDTGAATIVADTESAAAERIMPLIYDLTRVQHAYQFASFEDMYEEVFDRIPLSQLGHVWFLEHVAAADSLFYALAKRTIDLAGGIVMGIVTFVAVPFIWFANLFEGGGPLFIRQERFGQYGSLIRAYKFRSMKENDAGAWAGESKNTVTSVGAFLRKTSLDEFPQFLNILRGELSLIGPRNDIRALGERLASALPYYEARYLVTPGITGWAQINQRYEPGNASPQSVEETKVRLAYDFYYLKHRSFGLDIVIALKTVKRMLFRVSTW